MDCELTAERRALLTERLAGAEEAQYQLVTGGMARVFVDQNGERIEYAASNLAGLTKYIFLLKTQLGMSVSGPISPWM